MRIPRLPWWAWVLLGGSSLLIVGLLSLWAWGRLGWESADDAVADARTKGFEFDRDRWIDHLPPRDAALQAAALAWMQKTKGLSSRPGDAIGGLAEDPALRAWFDRPLGDPPVGIARFRDAWRPTVVEWRRLGTLGDPWLSGGGWADKRDLPFDGRDQIPILSGSRGLAHALAIEALIAADPQPWIGESRRLIAALARPGSLINGMVAIGTLRLADQAVLDGVRYRNWNRQQVGAWLAERPACHEWVADDLVGDVALDSLPYLAYLRQHPAAAMAFADPSSGSLAPVTMLGKGALQWVTMGHQVPGFLARRIDQIQRLRSEAPFAPTPSLPSSWSGSNLVEEVEANLEESATTAWQAEARALLTRAAVATILTRRERGILPEATADGGAPWIDALVDRSRLHLVYERLDDRSFRLSVDPVDPGSIVRAIPPSRWPDPAVLPRPGVVDPWRVEIHEPAEPSQP